MRFSLTVACVVSLATALAACSSSSQGISTGLPSAPSVSRAHPTTVNGKPNAIAIWATTPNQNTIYGLDKKANVLTAINAYDSGCYAPRGVKVDHQRNLWVGCESGANFGGGAVQEYDAGGSLKGTYVGGCPTNLPPSLCEASSGNGLDVATTQTDVFVSDWTFYTEYDCHYYHGYLVCNHQVVRTGFEYWPKNTPSAQPTMIDVYGTHTGGIEIVNVYGFDIDNSGNIWTTYGGTSGSTSGFGLVEIKNPTSPSFTVVGAVPAGTYGAQGAVYISNNGTVINVVDPNPALIYQYHLTPSFDPTPFRTLGPVPGMGSAYRGEPGYLGFHKGDKRLISADEYGWLDVGKVKKNKWKALGNGDFSSAPWGAAYSPSDK